MAISRSSFKFSGRAQLLAQLTVAAGLLIFAPRTWAEDLSIAVAASLQYVFDDLQSEFKKETGHYVRGHFSSSGKLVSQIVNGAPFDVLMSADMEYPEFLVQRGLVSFPPKVYAYGSLVLWTAKNLDLRQWQTLMKSPQVQKIVIANPKTAPYGREAIRVLKFYKMDQALQERFVFAESIAQTNQYIHSGLVDIGFTAKSVVLSRELKGQGKWIDVPANSYSPIAHGVVILPHAQEKKLAVAKQFLEFLMSSKARTIFQNQGYTLP